MEGGGSRIENRVVELCAKAEKSRLSIFYPRSSTFNPYFFISARAKSWFRLLMNNTPFAGTGVE